MNQLKDAVSQVKKWKSQDNKIVLVTGVFDLIHIEHIRFLKKAKLAGDKLLVGLETDSRVKHIKGPYRPINNQTVRLEQINALKPVDLAFLLPQKFNTKAAWEKLITDLKPDIYAVSSHTSFLKSKQFLVEKHGVKLKIAHQHNPSLSTSMLIAQIINPHIAGLADPITKISKSRRATKKPPLFSTNTITGHGRGKLLGYPTLNLQKPKNFPYQHGIYAGHIWLLKNMNSKSRRRRVPDLPAETSAKAGRTKYLAAFHFGPIPTFNQTQESLEAFLIDRSENISNKRVKFQLVHYLRPIKSFSTKKDLTTQIAIDVNLTQTLLDH